MPKKKPKAENVSPEKPRRIRGPNEVVNVPGVGKIRPGRFMVDGGDEPVREKPGEPGVGLIP